MRISNQQFIKSALVAIQDQSAQLAITQTQLATGMRLTKPSDDPSASVKSAGIRQFLSQLEQFDRNTDAAAGHLALQDGLLSSLSDLLLKARNSVIQAQNGINDTSALAGLREELTQNLDQIINLANTQDSNGEYFFAGSKSLTQPFFRDGTGQYQYAGDSYERELALSKQRRITTGISGEQLFMRLETGQNGLESNHNPANTGTGLVGETLVDNPALLTGDQYSINFTAADTYDITNLDTGALVASGVPFVQGGDILFDGVRLDLGGVPAAGDSFTSGPAQVQDIFTSIQGFIDSLVGQTMVTTDLANSANRTLENIDQAMERMVTEQARLGGKRVAVDDVRDANATMRLQFQTSLSEIEDLDYVEAASRLSQQSLALEAAQRALARVQNLSLFNFI